MTKKPDPTPQAVKVFLLIAAAFVAAAVFVYIFGVVQFGGREFTISFLASVVTLFFGVAIAALFVVFNRLFNK
ncbi:MAG: hypothetical protein IID01_02125 [Chloroflexi bacterium]|nr:hypothetical protein [Chloroflexota bacterium]